MANEKNKAVAPEKELFELCRKKAGASVWAVGAGMLDTGEFQWEVYVSEKKALRKVPKKFDGYAVIPVLAPKPSQPN